MISIANNTHLVWHSGFHVVFAKSISKKGIVIPSVNLLLIQVTVIPEQNPPCFLLHPQPLFLSRITSMAGAVQSACISISCSTSRQKGFLENVSRLSAARWRPSTIHISGFTSLPWLQNKELICSHRSGSSAPSMFSIHVFAPKQSGASGLALCHCFSICEWAVL